MTDGKMTMNVLSEDRVSINDLALGRAILVHPDDVAVVRRTDDDVVIGYVVRTPESRLGEPGPHAFVADQPMPRDHCLLFTGPNRVCGRSSSDPIHA